MSFQSWQCLCGSKLFDYHFQASRCIAFYEKNKRKNNIKLRRFKDSRHNDCRALSSEGRMFVISHERFAPESGVMMAECVQCFTLETAGHQCRCLWTLHFLCAVMFCQRIKCCSFANVSFVCVEVLCMEHWLGKSNITALEKCFSSQAAWQKWQLIQALVYLSQVINFFSHKKTPTRMMEKVGSLTLFNQASYGTLQCIGCWVFQPPVAQKEKKKNCRN